MKQSLTVINADTATAIPCMFPNWLEHWRKFSVLSVPLHCPENDCREKPEVGALVHKGDSPDVRCYVIPLCRKHSLAEGPLEVFTLLIPAAYADALDQKLAPPTGAGTRN